MTLREEFRAFAHDYVKLAERADTPELRTRLLELAREWTQASDEVGLYRQDPGSVSHS